MQAEISNMTEGLGSIPVTIPEIKIRLVPSQNKMVERITKPEEVAEFVRQVIGKDELNVREHAVVLYLNRNGRVKGYYHLSTGGVSGTIIDPKVIYSIAVKSLSSSIIISHNHPSGNILPSQQDVQVTAQLREAGKLLEVNLIDHIIVTAAEYFSFADHGQMNNLGGINKKLTANSILFGDVLTTMKDLPDESIDCVITSPPYWQLRDYGWKGQWGLEPTYVEYLDNLFMLMNEIKRVLKPRGTAWINLGDTFFGSGNGSGQDMEEAKKNTIRKIEAAPKAANNSKENKLPHKSLTLIPHRFAVGCVKRGWIVRNDIIWAKPNGIPESVKDRFAKRHEHIFLLVKQRDYYFDLDAVRDPHKEASVLRIKYGMTAYGGDPNNTKGSMGKGKKNGGALKKVRLNPKGKNPGDVIDFWTISTKRGSGKHYATFNSELVTKPILAGCPEGGIVLDPFCGTATTGVRAIELGRKFIGIEGKKSYCKIAEQNIHDALKGKNGEIKSIIIELNKLNFKKAA